MRTAFDLEDAKELKRMLSKLIEHSSSEIEAVESQWANLEATWHDQRFEQFEPQFEAMKNTLKTALESLEHYLRKVDEKILAGEKAAIANAALLRILGESGESYSSAVSSLSQDSGGLIAGLKPKFESVVLGLKTGSAKLISVTSTLPVAMAPLIAPMTRIAVQINSPGTDTSITQNEVLDLISKANEVATNDDWVSQKKKREEDETTRDAMNRDYRRKERRGVIFIEDD